MISLKEIYKALAIIFCKYHNNKRTGKVLCLCMIKFLLIFQENYVKTLIIFIKVLNIDFVIKFNFFNQFEEFYYYERKEKDFLVIIFHCFLLTIE